MRARSILAVGIPAIVVVLFFGAWAFDTTAAAGGTLRNVELDGQDIGRLSDDDLAMEVAARASSFADRPVEITVGDEVLKATAGGLSLGVDQVSTLTDTRDKGREGSALARPFSWAGSFASPLEVDTSYEIRLDQLELVLASLYQGAQEPREPQIVATADAVSVEPGQPGRALDPAAIAEALVEAAEAGENPITIQVDPVVTETVVSDAQAQTAAEQVNAITGQPYTVTVAGKQAAFSVADLRSWVNPQVDADGATITFDGEAITASLTEQIGSLGDAAPKDAGFTVEGGAVRIIPAVVGLTCCPEDAATQIADSLRAGERGITIEPIEAEPEVTTADAEALGIKEPVGTTTQWQGQAQVKSFTTYHPPGQPRVVNIQRIADDVRGTLVLPGETFSMNEVVGERTAAKGYVAAGAIRDGEHVDEIGGGVSQFATTMFNAVFFAGLPFVEYQAHSEWFDRYPRGREATMGHPAPDLKWKNDTPHGILVWTSYTATSITVTLYSTQYAYGEQTDSSESRTGAACTTVTVQRTIHRPDGSTGQDSVRATYRDKGARTCNG